MSLIWHTKTIYGHFPQVALSSLTDEKRKHWRNKIRMFWKKKIIMFWKENMKLWETKRGGIEEIRSQWFERKRRSFERRRKEALKEQDQKALKGKEEVLREEKRKHWRDKIRRYWRGKKKFWKKKRGSFEGTRRRSIERRRGEALKEEDQEVLKEQEWEELKEQESRKQKRKDRRCARDVSKSWHLCVSKDFHILLGKCQYRHQERSIIEGSPCHANVPRAPDQRSGGQIQTLQSKLCEDESSLLWNRYWWKWFFSAAYWIDVLAQYRFIEPQFLAILENGYIFWKDEPSEIWDLLINWCYRDFESRYSQDETKKSKFSQDEICKGAALKTKCVREATLRTKYVRVDLLTSQRSSVVSRQNPPLLAIAPLSPWIQFYMSTEFTHQYAHKVDEWENFVAVCSEVVAVNLRPFVEWISSRVPCKAKNSYWQVSRDHNIYFKTLPLVASEFVWQIRRKELCKGSCRIPPGRGKWGLTLTYQQAPLCLWGQQSPRRFPLLAGWILQ